MDLNKFIKEGKFLMLALDHRGSIKKLINPDNPDSVSDDQVIQLKSDIILSLADQFSGLLIDEVWGLEACKDVCDVKPFLLPVEKSGYIQDGEERLTELEYSVEQIMGMGASGAKMLLYFNPNVSSAGKQLETARIVLEDCRSNNFPLFLEIVTYGEVGGGDLILESVKKFLEVGIIPDVWKLEYPGSREECNKITKLVGEVPWILLTGGQTFEEFKPELEEAIAGGARGFLAGRALWQEVCRLSGEEKLKFLQKTLPERFKNISEVATKS